MFLIGLASVSAVIYGLMRAVYTGRWKYLLLWLWAVPLLGMVYFSSSDITINGLVVIIGMAMILLTIYSLSGYAMWNVSARNKKNTLKFVCFVLTLIISMYFYYQCCYNGYLDFCLNKKVHFLTVIIISVAAALLMNSIMMTAVDKYFSQKGTFIIIKCSPLKKNKNTFNPCVIKGVKNGVEYRFFAEKLYYNLLKNEKNLKFNIKKGAFGGVYVLNEGLFSGRERKKRRIKKLLRNRMLFALLTFILIILLILKLEMRMDFETIIITVMQAIFGRKL